MADRAYQRLVAATLRKHTRKLLREFKGVAEPEDIERIHQSRVAARRLRVALRMFGDCLPGKKVKRWRRAIARALNVLGPARDKDVQTAFVRSVLSGLDEKAHRPGIARLVLRLEQARGGLQPAVLKAAKRFKAGGVADEILAEAKRLATAGSADGAKVYSPLVVRRMGREILRRAEQLLAVQDCLANPDDVARHHAMRIAAKRLRYAMDACAPIYDGRLDEKVAAAKRLQDLLGKIRDCDVWQEQLATFLDQERERTITYFGHDRPMKRLRPGIEYMLRQRAKQRRQLFRQTVTYWKALNRQGLWGDLMQTVATRADPHTGASNGGHQAGKTPSEAHPRGRS